MELALWCDFRIAAENAQFGPSTASGVSRLIDGGTQRLPRIIAYGNAMWMINTGSRIGAERALQMGLVQELVPAGQALKRAHELAREIADQPQPALIADRRGVVASTERSLQSGIDFEAVVGRPVMRDPDVIERLTKYAERHR
jgi:enoyl-CoA hydratase/carnithine racemase